MAGAAADDRYPAFGYPWENNTLGMERVVPAPWTPVRCEQNRASVWGRTYELSDGVLPAQITSQGHPFFAAKPVLELVVDGHSLSLTGRAFTEKEQDRMRFRTHAASAAVDVQSETSLEYDGLLMVRVTITPKRPASLDRLSVVLPWRRDIARFFSRYVNYDFNAQRLDRLDFVSSFGEVNKRLAMPFNPAVWVGNHDVGAEWVCETDEGWSPREKQAAIVMEPDGDTVRMRLDIAGRPVRIDKPYSLQFALYPTPVKPLPEDWRRLRIVTNWGTDPAIDARVDKVYGLAREGMFPVRYPTLPIVEPTAVDEASEIRARTKIEAGRRRMAANHIRFILYGALYGMAARMPNNEWKDYAAYWRAGGDAAVVSPGWGALLGTKKGEPTTYYISVAPKSFRDFLVWQYVNSIEKYGIEGLYLDLASPNFLSRNPHHPGGDWVAKGGQYYPFFAQRDLMKRLWVACKSRNKEFFMIQHHAKVPVIVSGFSDVVLSGEPLNLFFRGPNFTVRNAATDPAAYVPDYSKLPRTMYEVQYSQTRGFLSFLLPEVVKWNDELIKAHPDLLRKYTQTLLARTSVYDVPTSENRMDRALRSSVLRAQGRFPGFRDARFIGPWKSPELVDCGSGKLSCGLYLAREGKSIMMVLSNLGEADASETVRPRLDELRKAGIDLRGGFEITDAMSGKAGDLRVTLRPNEFRMLIIR